VAWHDSQTNKRGKIMVEYIIKKKLYIMNEESELTTFQNRRGSSNRPDRCENPATYSTKELGN